MHRAHLSVLAVVAGVLATVALSACGATPSTNASANGESGEQTAVKFAKCMREHGIEATAQVGPGASELRIGSRGGKGTPQQMEAAQKACARFQPKGGRGPNLTPAERAQREDQVLAFARCMRQHGIDIPNPETRGAGIGIRIKAGVNPNDPKFQEAQKACQSLLPKPPGGASTSGGPGGGGPSLSSGG
jgi:hypothetical protein